MNRDEVIDILKHTGVLLQGHFLLTSGRHSAQFLQCSQLFQNPRAAAPLVAELVKPLDGQIDTVVGPAMGGVILAYEAARALGARAIYTEKESGRMVLKRGFFLQPGERVLVVEDAVTTGGSVRQTMEAVAATGAEMVGAAALVDRSGGRVSLGVPFRALVTLDIPSYEPDDCPLCRAGIPLSRPKASPGQG
ncbi:MAG: orotate phosphoribosyltransferase [Bacillota bacterium]